MCEYLRPVVALEWLKACCTDMITWMSSFSYEETLNTMTARNYQSWRCGRYAARCKTMISKWLAGFVQENTDPISWPTLLVAMRDARLGKLADEVEQTVFF